MKNINEILFIIQARCNSQRVPNKMLKPIGQTNLFEIALQKVKETKIPLENFKVSVFERPLKAIAHEHDIQCYNRSEESANEDNNLQLIYEWWDKFPQYKYAVIINACNLFLKPETIDKFIDHYCNSDNDGLFAVIPKKQYYWNSEKELMTEWPKNSNIMNTKEVGTTYEAAHVLYAGKLDQIGFGKWMGEPPYAFNNPELFEIDEFESLDIDYNWQFDLYSSFWIKNNDKHRR